MRVILIAALLIAASAQTRMAQDQERPPEQRCPEAAGSLQRLASAVLSGLCCGDGIPIYVEPVPPVATASPGAIAVVCNQEWIAPRGAATCYAVSGDSAAGARIRLDNTYPAGMKGPASLNMEPGKPVAGFLVYNTSGQRLRIKAPTVLAVKLP